MFGQNQQQAQQPSLFGGTSAFGQAQPAQTGSSFGAANTGATNTSIFGAKPTSSFGGAQQPAQTGFGQPNAAPTFGQPNAAPMFGQPNATTAFGQPAAAPTFGQPAAAPTFGQPAAAPMFGQPAAAPMFGQPAAPNAGQPAAPTFGQPQAQPFTFGQPQAAQQAQPNQTQGAFGFSKPAFGQPQNTQSTLGQTQKPSMFGNTGGGSLFGGNTSNTNTNTGTNTTGFGAANTSGGLFGNANNANSKPAFGQAQPAFGQAQPAFGQPAFGQSTAQPTFGQSTLGKPLGQSTLGQSTLGQSTLGQPALGQPAFGQSTLGQSTLGQSTLGKPAFGQSTLGQPTLGQSTLGQPSLSQSTLGQSTLGQPALGQSTLGQPAFGSTLGQSTLGQPTLGQSTLGQSTLGQSTLGQSTPGQPAFGQSSLGQPAFGSTLGQSSLGQSTLGQSSFGQSVGQTSQPAFGQPGQMQFGQPQFGQNTAQNTAAHNPALPTLNATLDQASYVLPGAAPSEKLYTSLSVPTKRSISETDVYRFETRTAPRSSRDVRMRTQLTAGPPSPGSASLAGPLQPSKDPLAPAATSLGWGTGWKPRGAAGERKWLNSYETFLRERPTTLIVRRPAQLLLEAPVAVAPPQPPSESKSTGSVDGSASGDLSSDAIRLESSRVEGSRMDDADASVFPRAPAVQVSQQALEQGYFVVPSLETLVAMTPAELSSVEDLVIGRRHFGQIAYPQPVNLSAMPNLGDILGKHVVFAPGVVSVYPSAERRMAVGEELDVPATVSIENAWPRDAKTREPITDMDDRRMVKHVARLKASVAARGGEFIAFTGGTWVFRVPHFSQWGLDEDEMVVDDDNDDDEDDDDDADENVEDIDEDDLAEPSELTVGDFDPADLEDEVEAGLSAGLELPEEELYVASAGASPAPLDASAEFLPQRLRGGPRGTLNPWTAQYNRAVSRTLTADAGALANASLPTQELDLGAILSPHAASPAPKRTKTQATPALDMRAARPVLAQLQQRATLQHRKPRANDSLPLFVPSLSFADLRTVAPARTELWDLLAVLFESKRFDADFSAWLGRRANAKKPAERITGLDGVWACLLVHDLRGAQQRAADARSLHLALLLALLDSPATRRIAHSVAERQTRDWADRGASSQVPEPIRRVYSTAQGIVPRMRLPWPQRLGLEFWYAKHPSLTAALAEVASQQSDEAGDEDEDASELLFVRAKAAPAASFTSLWRRATSRLDVLTAYLATLALPAPFQDSTLSDEAAAQLSDVLAQDSSTLIDAVLASLHVRNSKTAVAGVQRALRRLPATVALPPVFGVSDGAVFAARAFQEAAAGDFRREAKHLLQAGLVEDAHRVVIEKVGPQAVLYGSIDDVHEILEALAAARPAQWARGAKVYLEYALARGGSGNLAELLGSCEAADTPTLEARQAVSQIAQFVARRWRGHASVLDMKFVPAVAHSMALDQAVLTL